MYNPVIVNEMYIMQMCFKHHGIPFKIEEDPMRNSFHVKYLFKGMRFEENCPYEHAAFYFKSIRHSIERNDNPFL